MHRAASRTSGPQWGALSGRLFALACSCALVFVLVLAQLLLVARLFLGLLLPWFPVWCRQSPGAGQAAVRRSRPCPACAHTSQHERRAYQLLPARRASRTCTTHGRSCQYRLSVH